MDDKPTISGDFTLDDIEALTEFVQGRWWLRWLWGPMLSISSDDGGAKIVTGKVYGPLCGHGWYLFARKIDGKWRIIQRSPWKS